MFKKEHIEKLRSDFQGLGESIGRAERHSYEINRTSRDLFSGGDINRDRFDKLNKAAERLWPGNDRDRGW